MRHGLETLYSIFMKYIIPVLSLFLTFVVVQPQVVYAAEEGIAVVVNDNVITYSDINDRLKLIMQSSGMPNTAELRQRLAPQITSMLIEEQLKIQEASNLDIQVDQEQVDQGFANIAQQNNIPPEQFKAMLKNSNINLSTLYDQIRAEIAWGNVVAAKIRPRVDVTEADVDGELALLQNRIGETEYLISEIFLTVDDPAQDMQIRQSAMKIFNQLQQKPESFPAMARQFSNAAGAAQGGDLGWVEGSQLNEELRTAIAKTAVGSITQPIKSVSGYHILLLRNKRVLLEENVPDREAVLSKIGNQRLARRAKSYLLDLKASAFIENRVQ